MDLLTQNSKMKKSSANGIELYNFGIPAFQSLTGLKTCPQAGKCATGCYARAGTYKFGNTIKAYEGRLELTQSPNFVNLMIADITFKALKAKHNNKKLVIRIHDSGDFYNLEYWDKWNKIITLSLGVHFYAYTKMIQFFDTLQYSGPMPSNFRLIYSFGGKQDSMIDTSNHYHSKVFESIEQLASQGYTDATNNDLIAALGPNKRIGLVYHGVKGYAKTSWSKVK